jgi:hypothetical protein
MGIRCDVSMIVLELVLVCLLMLREMRRLRELRFEGFELLLAEAMKCDQAWVMK